MAAKLKDIAQASGVSISTVSRILSGDPSRKSSEATIARVYEKARELGYPIEGAVRASGPRQAEARGAPLREASARSGEAEALSIGCILTSDHESFVSPFFSSLLAGIQNELARQGERLAYRFFVMNIKDPAFSQFLQSTRLDCAIMLGRTTLENIHLLRDVIPDLVYAGVNSVGEDFDEVICDAYAGAKRAVEYLAGLGHRRIGYLGPSLTKHRVYNEHRWQGYLDGLKAAGLEPEEALVVDTLLTSADGYESALCLADRGSLPTAVFCGNDTVALGALKAFAERGISVPGDLSVVGFDDIETASYVRPALSTIAVPSKELGRLAVKVMLDRLETRRGYSIRVNLPFTLVERESSGKPRDA